MTYLDFLEQKTHVGADHGHVGADHGFAYFAQAVRNLGDIALEQKEQELFNLEDAPA
ncbi:MAG: hypothetical protein OEN49_11305 [Gammaproteobacteria bacterium]|nr:hypothetical protein [Gammaproteobacteria bacterium]